MRQVDLHICMRSGTGIVNECMICDRYFIDRDEHKFVYDSQFTKRFVYIMVSPAQAMEKSTKSNLVMVSVNTHGL